MSAAIREDIREAIRTARLVHHEADKLQRLRLVGPYYSSLDEALNDPDYPVEVPSEPSEEDIDRVIESWALDAERLRAYAEARRDDWAPHIVARWLARADEIDHRIAVPGAARLANSLLLSRLDELRSYLARGH